MDEQVTGVTIDETIPQKHTGRLQWAVVALGDWFGGERIAVPDDSGGDLKVVFGKGTADRGDGPGLFHNHVGGSTYNATALASFMGVLGSDLMVVGEDILPRC